ncbi:MAG: M15 family metallopeptidase, partial [Pygmaiobacter sp.]
GEEWMLRLVNANTPLPEDYVPELASLANGKQFDARAIDALRQMLSDGNAQGLSLMVCSAYRSIARQDELFSAMKQDYMSRGYSEEEATRITMTIRTPHACSEHSSGLAADIVAQSYQTLDDGFADTPEARWLFEHAVEYGFILRYPKDKQDVTGIIYEPWHYRYVGVENAKKITDSGLCLEEYLA